MSKTGVSALNTLFANLSLGAFNSLYKNASSNFRYPWETAISNTPDKRNSDGSLQYTYHIPGLKTPITVTSRIAKPSKLEAIPTSEHLQALANYKELREFLKDRLENYRPPYSYLPWQASFQDVYNELKDNQAFVQLPHHIKEQCQKITNLSWDMTLFHLQYWQRYDHKTANTFFKKLKMLHDIEETIPSEFLAPFQSALDEADSFKKQKIDQGFYLRLSNPSQTFVNAIKNHDVTAAKKALACFADVNVALDKQGTTPLILAAQEGLEEIVTLLYKRGADVNHLDEKGVSPLLHAIKHNRHALIPQLIAYGSAVPCHGYLSVYYSAEIAHDVFLMKYYHKDHLQLKDQEQHYVKMEEFGTQTYLQGLYSEIDNKKAILAEYEQSYPAIIKPFIQVLNQAEQLEKEKHGQIEVSQPQLIFSTSLSHSSLPSFTVKQTTMPLPIPSSSIKPTLLK